MAKFELLDGNLTVMMINAEDEDEAWKKIKRTGFRNRSKMFDLIRVE